MRIIDVSTGHPVALRYWDGSKWASIPNGNNAPQARTVHPPAGKTRNIGGGCAIMNLTVDPPHAPGVLVAANIPVVVDVANPVFEFDIIFRGSAGATPAELIQAAVSVGDDTPVPVTFGGAPSTTIRNPGNGQAVTVRADPTPITAAAGETIRFYGYTGAPEGGVSTGDQHGYVPGKDSWYAYGPSFAAAWNGVRLSPSTPGAKPVVAGMRPARIMAPSNRDSWLIAGDSIIHFYRSHAQRWAEHAGVAWAKNATGGGTHSSALTTFETAYVPGVKAASMVLDELGINGPSFADAMTYWQKMRYLGIEGIVKTTLTPRASSRDRWATVEGQTALADVAAYGRWDAWLLDGAPMKRDLSAAVETGAQGPDIVRCAVVDGAGELSRKGDSNHIFGRGGVVDWNPTVSAAGANPSGSRRLYRTDIGLTVDDFGDGLHFGEGVHNALATYLLRAMPIILSPEARTS
nr:MAG TPA: hypothetical protein [Caudoviricetes sp.]